jgi:His/Glu/Gln/Arg/opine family amino acid ABC transporter permease subunit
LTLLTSLLSLVVGIFIGSLRISGKRWATWPAALFVEIFRNTPALVQILFWAFALPNAWPLESRQVLFFNNGLIEALRDISGIAIPWYVIAAAIGLTLNTSAYIAELFRAGVRTVAQEHVQAAQSMGAPWGTIYRVILVPGGLRAAYPVITSRLIHNLKNTALASFVAVPELFNGIQTAINRTFMALEFLFLAALLYLALSLGFSWLLNRLEQLLYPKPKQQEAIS